MNPTRTLALALALLVALTVPATSKDVKDPSAAIFHDKILAPSRWTGETLADVAAAMKAGEVGRTTVDYTYTYTLGVGSERDRIATCEVVVVIGVGLAEWNHRGKRPAADREWDRFVAELARHEDGHVQIARRLFADAPERCIGQTPAACQAALDAIMQRERSEQAAFDRETRHGATTGAILRGAVDPRPR